MALIHATLTEDESVLLEALSPRAEDRCLALFAKGNGDAGLALLAAGAGSVDVRDLLAQRELELQLELKKRLIATMTPRDLRLYMGLEPGMPESERTRLTAMVFDGLSSKALEYWEDRKDVLIRGMVEADQTREFGRLLARLAPWVDGLRDWPYLLRFLLKTALFAAPLFYPERARRHSLGYRQLREDPLGPLDRLLSRAGAAADGDFVGAARMAYLSSSGLDRIRPRLDRIQPVATFGDGRYHKVYLANLVDNFSGPEISRLFEELLPRCEKGARLFSNSTRDGEDVHPTLAPWLGEGKLRIDDRLTRQLRRRDHVGVYPGLTVLERV